MIKIGLLGLVVMIAAFQAAERGSIPRVVINNSLPGFKSNFCELHRDMMIFGV